MLLSSNLYPLRNRVLIAACGAINCILAALCLHFYFGGTESLIEPIQRAVFAAAAGSSLSLQEVSLGAPETLADDDCNTLRFPKHCYGNAKVWAVHEGEIIHAALHDLHLYDEAGTRRLYCTDLHAVDPAVVMVQQGAGYPHDYFNDVPAAKVVKNGYPIAMRPKSTDVAVMIQFFCQSHFLYTTFLGAYLPKNRPAVVVDAGANIGLASILFSQVINFNGEVFAIEANPSTLEILERNVQVLGDLVKVVPAALVTEGLARKGVTVNFAAANKQEYWAFRVIPDEEVTNDMDVHRVPTYSLADIQNMSKSGHIDFLKLDIEGQEKYILEDKDSWPVLCTVRCMAAEVHDRLEAGATEALQTFLATACQKDPFQHVTTTGEYTLWCRPSVLKENF